MRRPILIAICVVLALIFVYIVFRRAEHFGGGGAAPSLTVTWSPPSDYPNPANLIYNMAVCYDVDLTPNHTGAQSLCSTVCPGGVCTDYTKWPIHVLGIKGTSINFGSGSVPGQNCGTCYPGQKLTVMLQAADPTTGKSSPWTTTIINLASTNPSGIAITDTNGGPIAAGSTGCVVNIKSSAGKSYNTGAVGFVMITLAGSNGTRIATGGTQGFNIPLTISGDVATVAIPFSSLKWISSPPAPLTPGQTVTVSAVIYEGSGSTPVDFVGSAMVTAQSASVGDPTNIVATLMK
jgi:hypothetical protein